MSIRAKLFTNGRSQAVRIPKDFAFAGVDAVLIEKQGNSLVLTPARSTWESFSELEPADDDYMSLRPRILKTRSQAAS